MAISSEFFKEQNKDEELKDLIIEEQQKSSSFPGKDISIKVIRKNWSMIGHVRYGRYIMI